MKTVIAILVLAGSLAADDNWQRMKDCRTQAENALLKEQSRFPDIHNIFFKLQQSHYSPKYGHCYALILFLETEHSMETLFDADEGDAVAIYYRRDALPHDHDDAVDICYIGYTETKCGAYKAYVNEHLEK